MGGIIKKNRRDELTAANFLSGPTTIFFRLQEGIRILFFPGSFSTLAFFQVSRGFGFELFFGLDSGLAIWLFGHRIVLIG
jgi:hypothetical protein